MNKTLYRSRLLVLVICALFLVALGRVLYLMQTTPIPDAAAEKQSVIRGRIEDRRGMPLAISEGASIIAVAPAEVYDSEQTAEVLARFLPLRQSEILERMYYNQNRKYFYLYRQLADLPADQLMDLRLPGVYRERQNKRLYPNQSLASNLLGFVGQDQHNALAGLERDYNDILITADPDSRRGHTIQLGIDALIQYQMELKLGEAFERSQARRAAGLLMDIQSGEILAMASLPNFNPNEYYRSTPFQRGNWNVRFNYEPGSTVKVFMAAMLLQNKLVRPDETFFCEGELQFGNASVSCKHNGRKVSHGHVRLADIISKSCNVGIVKAMQRMPRPQLYETMRALGFGSLTDVLPPNSGETAGYFPALQNWVRSTGYYTPIGQGFSVTPIQLLRAGASIANGGTLLQPVLVRRITGEQGRVITESLTWQRATPFSARTARSVMNMMEGVVRHGTGRAAFLPDIPIAGKTGTGEKSSAQGYLGKYVVSFMGFFPADKPRYGMLILFDEPLGSHSGGSLAAPVFGSIVRAIQPYLQTSQKQNLRQQELKPLPIHPLRINPRRIPDFRGLSARDSIEILSSYYDIPYELQGSGYVYDQNPPGGSASSATTKITLYLDSL
ncbi:MAG: transpeptidase family protein [Leptospiraceae bacterium]|nr:transpeptidase family protein [Leptospiraceae bacterium]